MKMIIGGAFQGKAAFAEKKYPEIEWVNGADADGIRFRMQREL